MVPTSKEPSICWSIRKSRDWQGDQYLSNNDFSLQCGWKRWVWLQLLDETLCLLARLLPCLRFFGEQFTTLCALVREGWMGRSCLYEYTSCKHMSAITIRKYVCLEHRKMLWLSASRLSIACFLSRRTSFACSLESLYSSVRRVTDMGLLKSFNVLSIEILGTVQESLGHWKRFSICVLTLVALIVYSINQRTPAENLLRPNFRSFRFWHVLHALHSEQEERAGVLEWTLCLILSNKTKWFSIINSHWLVFGLDSVSEVDREWNAMRSFS